MGGVLRLASARRFLDDEAEVTCAPEVTRGKFDQFLV